jgi:hypothetical protein
MLGLAALFFLPVIGFGVLLCRESWWQFSRRVRTLLLISCGTFLTAYVFMIWTHWGFSLTAVNHVMGWLALGGYSLLALLLTTLRPKRLTYAAACLLLLVSPAAALWMFVQTLAVLQPVETQQLTRTLFVDKTTWDAGAMGSSRTNLWIYEKPRYAPFLHHSLQWVRFDDTKCQAKQAFAVLQPDRRHVLARCPWPEYQHQTGFHDFLVPLYSR